MTAAADDHDSLVWEPAFDGQRPPWPKGNQERLKHGAYASVAIGPHASELADGIRAAMSLYSPADEAAVKLLAVALVRVERAVAAVDEVDESLGDRKLAAFMAEGQERLDRLRKDLRSWIAHPTKRRHLSRI